MTGAACTQTEMAMAGVRVSAWAAAGVAAGAAAWGLVTATAGSGGGRSFFQKKWVFALVKWFIPSVVNSSLLTDHGGAWGSGYGSMVSGTITGDGDGGGSIDYENVYGYTERGDGFGNGFLMPPTPKGRLFSEES